METNQRAPFGTRALILVTSSLLILMGLVVTIPNAGAATRAFAPRFTTNAQGDIVYVANTLQTCPSSVSTCGAAQTSTSGTANASNNNNAYNMVPVDTDGDPSTANSSSATLSIPSGGSVLFARLYWGAASTAANRGTVKFKTPGGTYNSLTTTAIDDSGSSYQASIDVTSAVQAAGSGVYTVADVQMQSSGGTYAGWTLVVVYSDPNGVMRNLTVFDGFQTVSAGPVTIPVSGFLTPPVGPVNTKLGVVAYEGDQGTTGDQLFLNNVAMSDGVNPSNNFFNASITNGGAQVGGRSPSYPNTLGFDADIINVPNAGNAVLANNATSATIQMTTTGDVYYPGVVTFVTDLYAPKIKVDKTYSDINGGQTRPGDVIEYTIAVSNTGKDPAIKVVLDDAIPANTTYVPGSLVISSGANPGAKSDSAGNDQGEFTGSAVKFFLGSGATGTAGGQLNENDVTTVKFRVTINTSAPDGVAIPNVASASFTALTLGSASTTPSVLIPVVITNKADLRITKDDTITNAVPGTPITYTIVVTNDSVSNTYVDNAIVADSMPSALTGVTWTCSVPSGSNCDAASGSGNINTTVDLAIGAAATFTVNATIAPGVTGSLINTATVTAPAGVTELVPGNNTATDTDALTPRADLSITKTDSSPTHVPGSPITYTLVAKNFGPSTVTGATIVDSPPAVAGTINWTCTPASACGSTSGTGPLNTLANLVPNATATYTVTYTVDPAVTGSLINTATVAVPTGVTEVTGVGSQPNSATDTDTLTVNANLSIAKTHTPNPIVAGVPVTYTITVTNPGPSTAINASVVDTLPTNFVVSGVTSSVWTCGAVTATFTCTNASVPAGSSTITVTGTFTPGATGTVSNQAVVSSPSDTDTTNNTATDSTTLDTKADLVIKKSHLPGPVVAGSTVTYLLSVQNNGPSVAAGATITDNFPTGLTPIAVNGGSAWTCTNTATSVSCNAATLPLGASTVSIDVLVGGGLIGPIDNTATVGATTADPVVNNSSTDTIIVIKQADLAISKIHNGTFLAGAPVQWTIVATNYGPSDATGVGVNDTPTDVSGITWTCVAAGGATCPAGSSAPVSGPIATSVDIPKGGTATFTLNGTLSSSPPNPVVNIASLAVPNNVTDTNPNNNSSKDTTVAVLRAALSVSKTNSQKELVPGKPTSYVIVAANAGPATATNAPLTDNYPADFTNVSWTCVGACPPSGSGSLPTTLTLAPNTKATFTVTGDVKPGATGTLSNTVKLDPPAGVDDPDTTDNTATDADVLTPFGDVGVVKTVTGGTVAGQSITYTVKVSNTGPSTAPGTTVTDALPAEVIGATWTCSATSGSSCGSGTNSLPLSSADLLPGGAATYVITGTVKSTFTGTLTNIATVAAPTGVTDVNPNNNSSDVSTEVIALINLKVTKDDGVTSVNAGTSTTYTINVTNTGPSTATNATVKDALPAEFSGATWTCSATAPSSCPAGGSGPLNETVTIAPGATISFTLIAAVKPSARDIVTNTVTVEAPADAKETDATDNTAIDADTIVARGLLTVTKTSDADPGPVSSGQLVTYTVEVGNQGPASMSGVNVADVVPAKLLNPSWTCAATGTESSCAASGVGGVATAVTIGANGKVTFTVKGTVDPAALGNVVNTATAKYPSDVTPTSGTTTVSTTNTLTIDPQTDLSITKTDGVDSITPGLPTTYTIEVVNKGPAAVVGASVVDTSPSVLKNVSWSCAVTAGLCAAGGGTVSINTTVNLPPNAKATFTLTGTVDAYAHLLTTKLSNTALVSAPNTVGEPITNNNSSTDDDTYTPAADLGITKTDSRTTAAPGTMDQYTIVVSNAGPSAVSAAQVVDNVPAALSSVTWTCTVIAPDTCANVSGSGSISTTVDLGPGSTATFVVTGRINADARGTLTNKATVTAPSGTTDPTANNTATDNTDLTPQADLDVTKTHAEPLVPGTDATWTITVANAGPSSVAGATVVDTLPTTLSNATWSCSVPVSALNACGEASGSGNINTTVDLAPGASATFTLTARISESVTGSLSNTASASNPSDVIDSRPGNNTTTDEGPLEPIADVKVTKTRVGSIVPGQPVVYRITVSNAGPSTSPRTHVIDTLPSPLTNATWSCLPGPIATSGAVCDQFSASGSGDVDSYVSLASGSTATYTVIADVPADATGAITNTAQVLPSPGVADPDTDNNAGSDNGVAEPRADLQISKTDGLDSVAPGEAVTYTIKVKNAGPSAVPGAAVKDTLPAALTNATWTCLAPSGSSCADGSGSGNIDTQVSLTAGATATFLVSGTVDSAARGTLTNTATVTAPASVEDADTTNNTATDKTDLIPVADVKVAKTHTGTFIPGTPTQWTIVVTNSGPSSVNGVSVSDTLPGSVNNAVWTCSVPAATGNACAAANGTGSISTTVDLVPGASATFVVDADIAASARGTLTNVAKATNPADTTDPAPSNNTATDSAPLVPTADLEMEKTHTGARTPGGVITYTMTITNKGPSTVVGARVADPLPDALTGATWTCTSAAGTCSTAAGSGNPLTNVSLPVGATALVTATATIDPDARGSLSNVATVTLPSDTTDPVPSNNRGSDTGPLVPQSDLSVTKAHTATLVPGKNITYTITVKNAGPSSAKGAPVKDQLPSALTNASWTCAASGGSACPSLGNGDIDSTVDLAVNGTATFTLTATVDPQATGSISNTATIDVPLDSEDPNPNNNTKTDPDTPSPEADISVSKRHSGAFVPGLPATWVIDVTNNGPSAVVGATVTDTLPSGLTSASWKCSVPSGAGNACAAATGTGNINTTVNLMPGSTATFTIEALVNSGSTGAINNTAVASVPNGVLDLVSANDSDLDPATRTPIADLVISKNHVPATVTAGQPVTYTIDVWNNGPSDAPNSSVVDTFSSALDPASISWTCTPLSGGNCGANTSGSSSINEKVDLVANSGVRYVVTADVKTGATQLSNTATVTTDPSVTDPDLDSNTAIDPGTVQVVADLHVDKTNVGPVIPGERATYQVVVTNDGPSAVVGASVTDKLPAGFTDIQWSCAATTPNSCPLGGNGDIDGELVNLDANGTATFTITALLDPAYRGIVTNTASAVAPTGTIDPKLFNNDGTDSTPVSPKADLVTIKTPTGPFIPGAQVGWTIEVTNNGPSTVSAARINDVLPAAVSGTAWTCAVDPATSVNPTNTPAFTNGCAIASGVGTVNNSLDLGVGAKATITVTATLDPAARGALTNGKLINTADAFLPSDVVDPLPLNNRGYAEGPISPTTELSVNKTHIGPLIPGKNVKYKIEVRNAGPSKANAAPVTDTLPSSLSGAIWLCSAAGGSCAEPSGIDNIASSVTLDPGGVATYTVSARIAANARGQLSNTARVVAGAGETDPTPFNISNDQGPLTPNADLSVKKTHSGELVPGEIATWSIVVTNAGPSTVVDASVKDTLPTYLLDAAWTCATSGVSADSSCGAASGVGSIDTTVSLDVNATATYTLKTLIDPKTTGPITNLATVRAPQDTSDVDSSLNDSTDAAPAVPSADLSLTKTHTGSLIPGSPVTYTIVVTNSGPSAVTNAPVTDTLPSTLSNGSWSCVADPGSTCREASGTGSISSAVTLNPGAKATYTLRADVSATAVGQITNTASVATPAGVRDPKPGNDQAADRGAAAPTADLKITKTHVGTLAAGKKATYVIEVSNAGPSPANDVFVADELPAYMFTPNWKCVATGQASCPASGVGSPGFAANIAAGAKITLTIETTLGPDAPAKATNTAKVTLPKGLTDPEPSSNVATDTGDVTPLPNVPATFVPSPPSVSSTPETTTTTKFVAVNTAVTTIAAPASATSTPNAVGATTTTAPSVALGLGKNSNGVAGNSADRPLALTGAEIGGLLGAAAGLVTMGAFLVLSTRRKRRTEDVK